MFLDFYLPHRIAQLAISYIATDPSVSEKEEVVSQLKNMFDMLLDEVITEDAINIAVSLVLLSIPIYSYSSISTRCSSLYCSQILARIWQSHCLQEMLLPRT